MCLKITEDSPSWHREAYFGELLRESDRAVKLYEAFPYIYSKSTAQVGYCLVSELAEHGAVLDFITNNGTIWNEAKAKKEITELLKLLDGMHRTGAIHRDLTPMNVFVCDNHRLKLGDFGIAKVLDSTKDFAQQCKGICFQPLVGTEGYWKLPT